MKLKTPLTLSGIAFDRFIDANDNCVGEADTSDIAREIIDRVNSHETLVAACKAVVTYSKRTSNCAVCTGAWDDHYVDCPVLAATYALATLKGT